MLAAVSLTEMRRSEDAQCATDVQIVCMNPSDLSNVGEGSCVASPVVPAHLVDQT